MYLSWHQSSFTSYLDIELFYLDIEVLLFILTFIAVFKVHAYIFHRKYLSWHCTFYLDIQFSLKIMHIKFIEYIYLDIKVILNLILTSIAVLEDYAHKIHWVYLSWHQSSFTSYLDIELFYLDIEVLLFILTSIAILQVHAYKFHRKCLSWH